MSDDRKPSWFWQDFEEVEDYEGVDWSDGDGGEEEEEEEDSVEEEDAENRSGLGAEGEEEKKLSEDENVVENEEEDAEARAGDMETASEKRNTKNKTSDKAYYSAVVKVHPYALI